MNIVLFELFFQLSVCVCHSEKGERERHTQTLSQINSHTRTATDRHKHTHTPKHPYTLTEADSHTYTSYQYIDHQGIRVGCGTHFYWFVIGWEVVVDLWAFGGCWFRLISDGRKWRWVIFLCAIFIHRNRLPLPAPDWNLWTRECVFSHKN